MTTLNKSLLAMCRSFSAMSRWPVDETGMNSVIPSTIPKMRTAIQSGIHYLDAKCVRRARTKIGAGRLFFRAPDRFVVIDALLDFELPQDRAPRDVDVVPL